MTLLVRWAWRQQEGVNLAIGENLTQTGMASHASLGLANARSTTRPKGEFVQLTTFHSPKSHNARYGTLFGVLIHWIIYPLFELPVGMQILHISK